MENKNETTTEENKINTDGNNITLEEAFVELNGIIEKMSADDISLEDSFELYNNGISLVKLCNEKIEKVEKKIEILENGGETDEL